ncbi:collagen alpha-1(I) chain-like [Monodelphis domestica]|uniref:collagen alpha-1(I) chain-like n=1 Tax=Monodelphis domestica TaxID=13616 RepID=UPI0024E22F5D|nr:collagen alpha-1(I) chain-like [Monodelphis domestica]
MANLGPGKQVMEHSALLFLENWKATGFKPKSRSQMPTPRGKLEADYTGAQPEVAPHLLPPPSPGAGGGALALTSLESGQADSQPRPPTRSPGEGWRAGAAWHCGISLGTGAGLEKRSAFPTRSRSRERAPRSPPSTSAISLQPAAAAPRTAPRRGVPPPPRARHERCNQHSGRSSARAGRKRRATASWARCQRSPRPPAPWVGRRRDPPGGAAAASPAGRGGAAGPGRAGLAGARRGALDPAPAAPPAAASRTRGGGAGAPAGATAAAAAGAAAHDSVTRGIRQSVTWTPGPVLALQPRDQPQPASAATGPAATNGAACGPHVIASELCPAGPSPLSGALRRGRGAPGPARAATQDAHAPGARGESGGCELSLLGSRCSQAWSPGSVRPPYVPTWAGALQ